MFLDEGLEEVIFAYTGVGMDGPSFITLQDGEVCQFWKVR